METTANYHKLTKAGKIDGRIFNGGTRKGAGRPLSEEHQAWIDFALEEVVVRELRYGQVRRVKKTRFRVVQDAVFKGCLSGSLRAMKLFNKYTFGEAERPAQEDS